MRGVTTVTCRLEYFLLSLAPGEPPIPAPRPPPAIKKLPCARRCSLLPPAAALSTPKDGRVAMAAEAPPGSLLLCCALKWLILAYSGSAGGERDEGGVRGRGAGGCVMPPPPGGNIVFSRTCRPEASDNRLDRGLDRG